MYYFWNARIWFGHLSYLILIFFFRLFNNHIFMLDCVFPYHLLSFFYLAGAAQKRFIVSSLRSTVEHAFIWVFTWKRFLHSDTAYIWTIILYIGFKKYIIYIAKTFVYSDNKSYHNSLIPVIFKYKTKNKINC